MQDAPAFSVASQETSGHTSGSRELLSDHAPSTTPKLTSPSMSPAPLLSMQNSELLIDHKPDDGVNPPKSFQRSATQSIYTCPSASVSSADAATRQSSATTFSSGSAERLCVSSRSVLPELPVTTDTNPSHFDASCALKTVVSRAVLKNSDHCLSDDEVEEVHSCITLSSTLTSPQTSQEAHSPELLVPPALKLLPQSTHRQQNHRHRNNVEEDGSHPLFSSDTSLSSSLQATFTHAPNLVESSAIAVEVSASPSPMKPEAAATTGLVDAQQGAVEVPLARGYRLLDSEPRGQSRCSRSENRIDPSFETTTTTSSITVSTSTTPLGTIDTTENVIRTTTTAMPTSCSVPQSLTEDESSSNASTVLPTRNDTLSEEQRYAYHLAVREHCNVFITGGAGTGKSHLLRTMIQDMPTSSTFVTATTGIAALNLNGTTLHSFVGCGVPSATATPAKILSIVRSKARCVRNWRLCRALIIDEVSMLESSFFDLVDYVARHLRNRPEEPFGGIQLILSGDFLQLPPVARERRGSNDVTFCFETETWIRVNPHICLLSTPFRQRDLRFFEVLNEMRFGYLQPDSLALLHSIDTTNRVNFVRHGQAKREGEAAEEKLMVGLKRKRPTTTQQSDNTHVVSVPLTSTFYDPSSRPGEQETRLGLIDGLGRPINAPFDGYTVLRSTRAEVEAQNELYFHQLDTEVYTYVGSYRGPGAFPDKHLTKMVHLRKGCRVMVIKNFDAQTKLVNGSTGTVTGFVSFSKYYRFQSTGVNWNDAREICVGQGGNVGKRHTMLPLVAFDARNPPGHTGVDEIVVEPQEWVEKEGDRVKSRCVQIPLVPAYAITIHKSQGMSLMQVDIDFTKVFEAGQSYVALSRCTDMQRLRLHGFSVHLVSANSAALAYYKALALEQQRLEWQRQYASPIVAAAEAAEARSCSLYGFVLSNEASAVRHYGQEDSSNDFSNSDENYNENNDDAGTFSEEREESAHREGDNVEGDCQYRRQFRQKKRRKGDRGPTGRLNLGHPSELGGNDRSNNGNEEGDWVNETQRLDRLRRRIAPLLYVANLMKRRVLREMLPLLQVHNSRLVMDFNALFHFVTGPESATAFDVLFRTQENMMRVPLCVQRLVEEAAAHRCTSISMTRERQAHSPYTLQQHQQRRKSGIDGSREDIDSPDAALLAASDVAAEALAVMARARQDYILDVQRPEQTALLPEPNKDWLRFASVLPMLLPNQRRVPTPNSAATNGGATTAAAVAVEGDGVSQGASDAAVETSQEANFILNRDPRETVHHRAIIEYALFLKTSFGQDVVVCTDSIVLAAYALAWGLRVVSAECLF